MLFDFSAFVEELRQKEDKKEIVEKYEKIFGSIEGQIKDQKWYQEYVKEFDNLPYSIPEDLKKDYDWDLLQQLVVASFSSDYEFKADPSKDDKKKELFIAVSKGDQSVVKTVSELWNYQVLRLFEIYVEEQINLHALKYEDDKEKDAIDQERSIRRRKWMAIQETLNKDEVAKQVQKEQSEKLSSLYDQL